MQKGKISSKLAVAASHKRKEKEYWLAKLSGELVRSAFPYDTTEDEPSFLPRDAAAIEKFQFSTALSERLLKVSKGSGKRLHIILTAGLAALLKKYTGNCDIIIGTPIYKQEQEDEFINTALAIRSQLEDSTTFKELLLHTGQTIVEAMENQNYPLELLVQHLEIPVIDNESPLFDTAILVENIHDIKYIRHIPLNMIFLFHQADAVVTGAVEYHSSVYRNTYIKQVIQHFTNLLEGVLANVDLPITVVDILSPEEKKRLLVDFNDTSASYPTDKTIHQLFEKQVENTPGHLAILWINQSLTYWQLDQQANQLANYLYTRKHIQPDDRIGILMDREPGCIIAVLGILKAGGVYVPIEPGSPEERIKSIINDASIGIIISQKKYIRTLNRLQWECSSFQTFLCMDSADIYAEKETQRSELMSEKLWNYVAETAQDEIAGGGWNSSYTGEPFSKKEMDEYGDNVLKKIQPLLYNNMRVLEIGCASGITMYRLAPLVGLYYGTDLSSVVIEKNREQVKAEGHDNIRLSSLPAHQIDQLRENHFDLVILNSVIQSFHGHNYLRQVIQKVIHLLGDRGYLFIGDIMDQDLKDVLIRELADFKQAQQDNRYKTKTDWSTELFISRSFFEDLMIDIPVIQEVTFSRKIHTIENELTKFRYDALITVDKQAKKQKPHQLKHKYQEDLRVVHQSGTQPVKPAVRSGDIAYIIYTSGTTGKPKGVMVEHQNLVNYTWWAARQYIDSEDSPFPFHTTLAFDLTVTSIFPPLITGNRIIIYDNSKDRLAIQKVLQEDEGRVIKATPSHLKVIQGDGNGPRQNSRFKRFVVGGEQLETELARDISRRFSQEVEIYNEYGPTEATVGCMIYQFDHRRDGNGAVPIGRPIDNVKIYLVDDSLQPVPINAVGEICISGAALARGYINRPQLTSEKFVDNPFSPGEKMYRTGDLARKREDGNILFLGRRDEQVKIRGYRVEIKEIEMQLLKYSKIKEALVIAREDKNSNKNLCAYIVTGSGFELSELKDYLSGELPAYMIPAYFINLEHIPLTPNNKVDKKQLPQPADSLESGAGYEAPQDEIEEILVKVWQEVLGIERIGINDNFFEMGGDSIKIIQAAARLQVYRLTAEISDSFLNPTIKQLAPFIKKLDRDIDQGEVVGKVELTPIQLWFFKNYSSHYHHFNQAVMLYRDQEGFNEQLVEKVFRKLVEHHDALRMKYEINNTNVTQRNSGLEGEFVNMQLFDFTNIHDSEAAVESEATRIQGEIDLSKGPLVKLALFKTAAGDHLLVIIHHLVIDGVSWRILLEDFQNGYQQCLNRESIVFPAKTDSFKYWSEQLKEYAHGKTILDELSYWKKVEETRTEYLPVEQHLPVENKIIKNCEMVHLTFDEDQTNALLREVHWVYNTTIIDFLLTALGMALRQWAGVERVLVSLEGHGREPIIKNVKIDRTVGWFASRFPVILDMCHTGDLSHQVKVIKEILRRIPNNGVGYEILKYLVPEEKTQGVTFNSKPEICFNYLGEFGQEYKDRLFSISHLKTGETISPDSPQLHQLEVNGMVVDRKLTIWFIYNALEFQESRIQELANDYKVNVINLINHCIGKKERELTPDDVAEGEDLSIEELEKIKEFAQLYIEE